MRKIVAMAFRGYGDRKIRPRHRGYDNIANSVKPNLSDARLYGILDLNYINDSDAVFVAEAMIKGGVDLIQLRGKERSIDELAGLAAKLHELTAVSLTALIVNDHAEIAKQVPVEGVHVGQDDDSIHVARRKAGRDLVVGKSTHNLEQALAAQREGADYIGFGPVFATPTKPDYAPIGLSDIKRVHAEVSLPIFCIGGINIDNLQSVIDAGAKRVVMVSALLKAHSIVDYARCATDMLA
jgi:thiamine-phosphate pyrophosphorylase